MLKNLITSRLLVRENHLKVFSGLCNNFCSKTTINDNASEPTNNATTPGETEENGPIGEREKEISQLLDEAASFAEMENPEWMTTPYMRSPATRTADDDLAKPVKEPQNTSVILFPGQGIVQSGQLKRYLKFPRVQDIIDCASEQLKYNVYKLCMTDSQEKLNKTKYNQVATVVISLAALEQLREERPTTIENCVSAAGFSVGEFTALIFAGSLPLEEGLQLVSLRAEAMQNAADRCKQGMMSAYIAPACKIGKAMRDAKAVALDKGVEDPVCSIAIYSYTQGKVIAGHQEALDYLLTNAQDLGLRKVRKLPVSGAFHTSLMEPAIKPFVKALNRVPVEKPRVQVISNVIAKRYDNIRQLQRLLPLQIVRPVRWEQSLHMIYSRPPDLPYPKSFDCGSGGRMKAILQLVNGKAADNCVAI